MLCALLANIVVPVFLHFYLGDALVLNLWPRFECDFVTEVLVIDVVAQFRKSSDRAS